MGLRSFIHSLTAPALESVAAGQYKMALIVNHSLGMKKGKIAAQVAHGAVSATLKANPELLEAWFAGGQAKVTLKGTDDEQLLYLHEKAKLAGLNSCIIRDAGRTQIPSGSLTVVAIGPALKKELNQITGEMKLL
jgi:PTH2 family peptidyl-tRNA hydrolase